jgi:UDP-N-acetylglucosamine 2-epimerase (non-hydrolysing)
MSGLFFRQLAIPNPDYHLGAGGGTQSQQTARIMIEYEKIIQVRKPDVTVVVGDVTSTMACSITAKKMGVKVAHVEAGIRSGDWTMPEEINRVLTDSISDLFYTTSETAVQNLLKIGVNPDKIVFTGNTMIDSLLFHKHQFRWPEILKDKPLSKGMYWVLTIHRPNNVDEPKKLYKLLKVLDEAREFAPIIFPVHPRTLANISKGIELEDGWHFIEPQGYFEFNYLVEHSMGVITDSGGVTEETTVLRIPCLTLRTSTERPETVTMGTNYLIGDNYDELRHKMNQISQGNWKDSTIPPLWDGKSAERIVAHLVSILSFNGRN